MSKNLLNDHITTKSEYQNKVLRKLSINSRPNILSIKNQNFHEMILFFAFHLVFCEKILVGCFDNNIKCSSESLKELPFDSECYDFISSDFLNALINNKKGITSIIIVFSQDSDFELPEITSADINIKLYSPYEDITIRLSSTNENVNLLALNVSRVKVILENKMTLMMNSGVYFENGGDIENKENIVITPTSRKLPLIDIDKYKLVSFTSSAFLNLFINNYEFQNNIITIDLSTINCFGYHIPLNYYSIHQVRIYINYYYNSNYDDIILDYVPRFSEVSLSLVSIFFEYILHDHERNSLNHPIFIRTNTDWSGISFMSTPTFEFCSFSSTIKLNSDIKENNIKILLLDDINMITYIYPNNIIIHLNYDDTLLSANCYTKNALCIRPDEEPERFEQTLTDYAGDYITIWLKKSRTIDLSNLNFGTYLNIEIHGDTSNIGSSHLTFSDINIPLTKKMGLLIYYCIVTFPNKTIRCDNQYLHQSSITNPQYIAIVSTSCLITNLEPCQNTHFEEIFIGASVDDPTIITLYENKLTYNNYEFDHTKFNTEKLIFQLYPFNFDHIYITVDPDLQDGSKVEPLNLFYLVPFFKVHIEFDIESFESKENTKFEIEAQGIADGDPIITFDSIPNNVHFKKFNALDNSIIFDNSPIEIESFGICHPGTYCSESSTSNHIHFHTDMTDYTLETVQNRLNNSINSDKFSKFKISYSYINDLNYPQGYDIYDSLELDLFTKQLLFTSSNVDIVPTIELSTTRSFHGESLTVDRIILSIQTLWHIPILKMINGGFIKSTKSISTQYAEIDLENVELLNNMNFQTIHINIQLGNTESIVISSDNIQIGSKAFNIKGYNNNNLNLVNITLIFSQTVNEKSTVNFDIEQGINPPNFIFNFISVQSSVDFIFSNKWKYILNSPLYTFISNHNFEVEIQGAQHPIQYVYRDPLGTIFEEFPVSSQNRITVCCSPPHQINDYCHNLSTSYTSFFKRFTDISSLISIFNSFEDMVEEFNIITHGNNNKFTLDLNSFQILPKKINFTGIESYTAFYLHFDENTRNSIQEIIIDGVELHIDSFEGKELSFKTEYIYLKNGNLYSKIDTYLLSTSLTDLSHIFGEIDRLILNYTCDNYQTISTIQHTTSLLKSVASYKHINSSLRLTIGNNETVIGSKIFTYSQLTINSIEYDITYSQTTNLTLSIQSIPRGNKITIYNHFIESNHDGNEEVFLIFLFDETWNHYSESLKNYELNILSDKSNAIFYTAENIPNIFKIVNINGVALYDNSNNNTTNGSNKFPLVGLIVVFSMLIIIVIVGIVNYFRTKKRYSNVYIKQEPEPEV